MKPLAISILLLFVATVHADPGWQNKVIGNVGVEVPANCKRDVQDAPGAGAVQRMKKYSFRNRVLDLKAVFLSFRPGTSGNLDGAAANMTAQLKAVSGEESRTPWKSTTVSGVLLGALQPNQTACIKQDKRPSSTIRTLKTNSS